MARKVEEQLAIPNIAGDALGWLKSFRTSLSQAWIRMATRSNGNLPKDGTEAMTAPLPLGPYTTTSLPSASSNPGAIIYVSDGAAGTKFRGSDGTSWVNLG